MKTRFGIWLLLCLLLGLLAWLGFSRPGAIQTDLLALLPATESHPRAEEAVAALAHQGERRSLYLLAAPSRAEARAAGAQFAAQLDDAKVYRAVRYTLPTPPLAKLIASLLPYRFGLLSEADRAALLSGNNAPFEQALMRRLYSPLATGLATPLAQDPYGLLARFIESRPWLMGGLHLDEGVLATERNGQHYVLISAELSGSAFDDELQQRVQAAVDSAEALLARTQPAATLLRLGAIHYGAAARAQAESEMSVIGTGSGLGIAVLMLLVFRALRELLLSYLPVLIGIAAGATACVWVFGHIHVLTLVFGASLIGVAVDYPLHYFVARLAAGGEWQAERGLKQIGPGITLGLLASLLGYGGLLFAPFSVLQQIALYSTAGLIAAWASTVLALPLLLKTPSRAGTALLRVPERILALAQQHLSGPRLWLLFALLGLLCLPGLYRLKANDDVHLLVSLPPALKAQEAQIRALAGGGAGNQFFLVEGRSAAEVLEREEALRRRLDGLISSGTLATYSALSRFVPSPARQAEDRALSATLLNETGRAHLAELGFAPPVLEALASEQANSSAPLTPAIWLNTPFADSVRALWLGEKDGRYASIVLPGAYQEGAALRAAAVPGTHFIDKTASVSRLFTRYRQQASWLVGLAFAAVLGLLMFRYGARRGLLAMSPSLLAVACALAVLGLIGLPLTLFNIIALMLVLGIGIDYAIFMLEGGEHGAATLLAVSLSALTTVLSFGLLALSATPALQTFGLSVLVGIAVAHTLTPLIRGRG